MLIFEGFCLHFSIWLRNIDEGNRNSIKDILGNTEEMEAMFIIEECIGF